MSNWAVFLFKTRWSLIDALAKLLERLARGEVVIVERISGAEVCDGDELMVLGIATHSPPRVIDGRAYTHVSLDRLSPWSPGNGRIWTWGRPWGTSRGRRTLHRVIWRNVLEHQR